MVAGDTLPSPVAAGGRKRLVEGCIVVLALGARGMADTIAALALAIVLAILAEEDFAAVTPGTRAGSRAGTIAAAAAAVAVAVLLAAVPEPVAQARAHVKSEGTVPGIANVGLKLRCHGRRLAKESGSRTEVELIGWAYCWS